jgi:hypothetical protein
VLILGYTLCKIHDRRIVGIGHLGKLRTMFVEHVAAMMKFRDGTLERSRDSILRSVWGK